MFPEEYIRYGRISFTSCCVTLYSDYCHTRSLDNVPPRVVNAWWQCGQVHVLLDDGWHYVWTRFGNYDHRWKD